MLLALKAARDAINHRPGTPGHFIFVGTGSHRALVSELSARRNQAFVGATSIAYPVLDADYVTHLLERLRTNPLDPTSAHLRDSLRLSLSTLDVEERDVLVRMADRGDDDNEHVARALSVRGLVRRAGPRYEVLNLVRAAVLEPVSGPHLAGGVALTWPC